MKNIVDAIVTLVERNDFILLSSNTGNNRANNQGEALETYAKNLFADTFDCTETERMEKWNEIFSLEGSKSNPPDFMLRGGDAVEVKKIESPDAALALNSSYPKHTLKSSSPLISAACRSAEDWSEKDVIYIVGVVSGERLKHLCMVYGQDYCASEEFYSRIRQRIKDGVETIPGVEFAHTKELGRVNRVDPLGITYVELFVCQIANPWQTFNYVCKPQPQAEFDFMCIINSCKWEQLANRGELSRLQDDYPALKIADVRIKNPDNPIKLQDAKLITYVKERG